MLKEGIISQKSIKEEEAHEVSKRRKSDHNGRFFFRNCSAAYKVEIKTSGGVIQDLVTLLKILIIHLHLFHSTALEKVCL